MQPYHILPIAEHFGGRKFWQIASQITFGYEGFGKLKPRPYRCYKQSMDNTLANLWNH